MPNWASALALQLHMDALTLHLTVLTLNMIHLSPLNLNHLSPLNQNSCLKKSQHVHAHHLEQWKNEGVCMQLLRYMRDTFLKLDTSFNDESVRGKINKPISLHTIGVSNKNSPGVLWIMCLPLFRGNPGPCT
jgi:hypothetical protein